MRFFNVCHSQKFSSSAISTLFSLILFCTELYLYTTEHLPTVFLHISTVRQNLQLVMLYFFLFIQSCLLLYKNCTITNSMNSVLNFQYCFNTDYVSTVALLSLSVLLKSWFCQYCFGTYLFSTDFVSIVSVLVLSVLFQHWFCQY